MQLVALVVIAVVAASSRPADACSCGPPHAFMLPDDQGPTNTHVLVWLPPADFDESLQLPKPPFVLRAAGTAAPIAADQRTVGSGEWRVVELVPKLTLRPKTKFEVIDATGRMFGTFTTTDGPMTAVPQWGGIANAEYRQFKNGGGGSCMRGQPFARVTIGKPAPTGQAIYGLWLAGKDGKIDYAKPPHTYVLDSGDSFVLGSTSNCRLENFEFPKAKSLVIGAKLVDIAGNASAPSQATLNLAKPIIK